MSQEEEKKPHQDPELNPTIARIATLFRLPPENKFSTKNLGPADLLRAAAEEIPSDDLKRAGQNVINKACDCLNRSAEPCVFTGDIFPVFARIIGEQVAEATIREKLLADLQRAKQLYKIRLALTIALICANHLHLNALLHSIGRSDQDDRELYQVLKMTMIADSEYCDICADKAIAYYVASEC
jgi:hypothetical protein